MRISVLLVLSAFSAGLAAEEAPMPVNDTQFVMILELTPRLWDEDAWTAEERQTVAEHFAQLSRLAAQGTVRIAGRTPDHAPKRMAIVVLDSVTEEAAQRILAHDAAVAAGIMTGEILPFRVVLEGHGSRPPE